MDGGRKVQKWGHIPPKIGPGQKTLIELLLNFKFFLCFFLSSVPHSAPAKSSVKRFQMYLACEHGIWRMQEETGCI